MYKLNYPMQQSAVKYWESRHRLNRIKAIIAYSTDLDNANDNLRRRDYPYSFRQRYLKKYAAYVANPSMKGIPYSDLEDNWYNPQ
jgi:hypothetical protein